MVLKHGQAYLDFALFREVLARYGSTSFAGPERGLLYYFKVWPADAAPWTLFFIAALALLWGRGRRWERRLLSGALFSVCWFVVVLVVFSLSRYKLPHYLLPLYPALALLVGLLFDRACWQDGTRGGLLLAVPSWLTAATLAGLSLLSGLFLLKVFENPLTSPGMLLPLALGAGAVLMAVFAAARRPLGVFAALTASMAAGYLVLAVHSVPRDLERYKPVRPLARVIASQYREGDAIGLFRDVGQGFVFYTEQEVIWLHEVPQVAAFLAADGRRFVVLHSHDYAAVRDAYPDLHRLAERPLFLVRLRHLWQGAPDSQARSLILVSNRPGGGL
jgi:4-amino-4-deoxy-L-arabinose transferase-like glycosyltransferase